MDTVNNDRRSFIKKAVYVAPVVITMAAIPSFASAGSGLNRRNGRGRGHGHGAQRPGHRKN